MTVQILKDVTFIAGFAMVACLWWFVMNPKSRALSDEEKERAYQHRVEAAVAKRLDAERFEADVQRRLLEARSTEATREDV